MAVQIKRMAAMRETAKETLLNSQLMPRSDRVRQVLVS